MVGGKEKPAAHIGSRDIDIMHRVRQASKKTPSLNVATSQISFDKSHLQLSSENQINFQKVTRLYMRKASNLILRTAHCSAEPVVT